MTEYKLVPVEPTAEMQEAGKYALEAGCYASGIYADMLADSPDVQVEPVAWQRVDRPERIITKLSRRTMAEVDNGVEFRALYAAPQPPFQLPDFATDPDDSDEVASLWDHGFKRGWNSCLGAVAKDMQPTKQQPDITQLVEALEELVDLMQGVIDGDYVPDSFTLQPATIALAAYRKGGE